MFVAHFGNTMRNARPKFYDPEPVRTMAQIRAEKREEAAHLRRLEQEAWVAKRRKANEEREAAAQRQLQAQAPSEYRSIDIRAVKPPVRQIIERIAAFHGTTYDQIVGVRLDRGLVAARHDAIKAVSDARPDLSSPQIGKFFNRDHTTILHALAKTSGTMRRVSTVTALSRRNHGTVE